MKFNDIDYRIKVLFKSVEPYLAYKEIKKGVTTEEKIIDKDGKELIRISFGGGQITENETLEAQIEINTILDNLANLKDNLKKGIAQKGLNKQLVEDYINGNLSLQIITDLDNQIKHGYPLTKSKRSNLDPKIEDIRHELAVPMGIGFSNVFTDGKVVYEADINDKDGNRIFLFRNLIENAIELWEKFIVRHLPEKASEVQKRMDAREKVELANKKIVETQIKCDLISNKEDYWHFIENENLKGGMYLKVLDNENLKEIWKGVAISNPFKEGIVTYITIREIFSGWLDNSYNIEEKKWKILSFKDKEEAEMFNNHYLELNKLRGK
ncbi:hypothetical protein [Lacinutrix sp.]|uniref:hypothetical protein n=1 Tax=Lacinutrix sp. TaxID=1937692 RepID=UPI0025B83490|nr:hypothetical protein [Lacinutrix sp.]